MGYVVLGITVVLQELKGVSNWIRLLLKLEMKWLCPCGQSDWSLIIKVKTLNLRDNVYFGVLRFKFSGYYERVR